MATSSSYNFATNRDDIIKASLRIIGAIGQGGTPTPDQYNEAAIALNMLVKAWMADGMPLWAMSEASIVLTEGTASYTLNAPKALKIVQAYNHNTTTNIDIPMRIISWDEYNRLGNKTSQGTPIQVFAQPGISSTTIKVFPVPDSSNATNNKVVLVYQKPYEDFDESSDEPAFPQEWYDALVFNLANRLAPQYGMSAVDRNQLRQDATSLHEQALSFGTEEVSVYFSPEIRNGC